MILFHNHFSNSLQPSAEDLEKTRKINRAGEIIHTRVQEHLTFSPKGERYFSFADPGVIGKFYDEIG